MKQPYLMFTEISGTLSVPLIRHAVWHSGERIHVTGRRVMRDFFRNALKELLWVDERFSAKIGLSV